MTARERFIRDMKEIYDDKTVAEKLEKCRQRLQTVYGARYRKLGKIFDHNFTRLTTQLVNYFLKLPPLPEKKTTQKKRPTIPWQEEIMTVLNQRKKFEGDQKLQKSSKTSKPIVIPDFESTKVVVEIDDSPAEKNPRQQFIQQYSLLPEYSLLKVRMEKMFKTWKLKQLLQRKHRANLVKTNSKKKQKHRIRRGILTKKKFILAKTLTQQFPMIKRLFRKKSSPQLINVSSNS